MGLGIRPLTGSFGWYDVLSIVPIRMSLAQFWGDVNVNYHRIKRKKNNSSTPCLTVSYGAHVEGEKIQ